MGEESKQTPKTVLNRLNEEGVRGEVEEVFRHYYEDLLPVLVIATAESDGKRPEGLCNEIYSCFHHIARALCEQKVDIQDELKSAKKSHLKRAIFDSYKIAINAHLGELSEAKNLLGPVPKFRQSLCGNSGCPKGRPAQRPAGCKGMGRRKCRRAAGR